MHDLLIYLAIAVAYLLAGSVKGVIGMGLPTVSLGLLAALLDLPTAMALLIVPSFATNLWQATSGEHTREIIRRFWPFFLSSTLAITLGVMALVRVNTAYLSILLGLLLITYALLHLAGRRFTVPAPHEKSLGLLSGSLTGLLTGMTGSSLVPGVMYLQGLGLKPDRLVQAMGILFTANTVTLALALGKGQVLTGELALISTAAVIPAILGMRLGRRIRRNLSEERFKRVFFVGVLFLGLLIIVKTLILFGV